MVCELCTPRAAHEGWIREGLDDVRVRDRGDRRSRSLLGRLRNRLAEVPPPHEAPSGDLYEPVHEVPAPEPEPEPEPAAVPEPVAYEEPSSRSVHAVPTNADLKVARAVELFNGSEHPRTVSGVSRSLGAPVVAVRPSLTEGSV